jgi:hypothetical protein
MWDDELESVISDGVPVAQVGVVSGSWRIRLRSVVLWHRVRGGRIRSRGTVVLGVRRGKSRYDTCGVFLSVVSLRLESTSCNA